MKESLLLQKQTIPQKKALDLSFLQMEFLRAWHDQEGATPPCRDKHRSAWGKKVILGQEGVVAPWYCHTHFEGVILKLNIRAFFLDIVCFSASYTSTIDINLNLFPDIAFTPCRFLFFVFANYLLRNTPFRKCWQLKGLEGNKLRLFTLFLIQIFAIINEWTFS
jgi:hypothetical protein